ncbi:MAG: AAA family ATPase [Anaerolineae bacterium]|jgi:predicted ATPase
MFITKVRINQRQFPTQGTYPFNVPAICQTQELTFRRPVTFFVGENGSGKSTLLEAITRKCGVHVWDKPRRHRAHNNPFEDKLSRFVTVSWANGRVSGSLFRAETFYEFADFLDDVALCDPGRLAYHGGRILNTLSHGEGILSYFRGRFQVKGLYFLDEPEAALSPASQVKFLNLLHQVAMEGHAQFIIATHSPILLACPSAQIFGFGRDCIREMRYEETEHYQLYAQFFADRSAFLSQGEAVS